MNNGKQRIAAVVAGLVVVLCAAGWFYNKSRALHIATVTQVYWKGEKPYPNGVDAIPLEEDTDVILCIKEWIPGKGYEQLAAFESKAGKNFLLTAPNQEPIHLTLDGSNYNSETMNFQAFGATIASSDKTKVKPGVVYTLVPQNQNPAFKWVVPPTLVVKPFAQVANASSGAR